MGCLGFCKCRDEKDKKKGKNLAIKDYKPEEIPKNKIHTKEIKPDLNSTNPINEQEIKDFTYDMKFIEDALKTNNEFRELHGVEELKQDEYLIDRAHILAKQLLIEESYDNSNMKYKNGEDLGMNNLITEKKLDGNQLMNKWYEEKNEYNFQENNGDECTNFTQMIWKNSQKFGIGYFSIDKSDLKERRSNPSKLNDDIEKVSNKGSDNPQNKNNKPSKKFCYVALYYPTGNKVDKYKENVFKTKKTRNDNNKTTNDGNIDDKNKKIENGQELTNKGQENNPTILDDKILNKENSKLNEKYQNEEKNPQEKHELDKTLTPVD